MKNSIIIVVLAITFLTITACNHAKNTSSDHTGKVAAAVSASNGKQDPTPELRTSVNGIISNYLQLKNALAADNSNDAATAGKAIATGLVKFDRNLLTREQKKSFDDIASDAKEMAEHIGESAGKLPHQREHFEMLSQDMIDLAKLVKTERTLYIDHCPMYNNNKGANWLSEIKSIKNPYLGSKMTTCGSVKEELK